MKPDICIYHGNCADGFTAAWAVHKLWPDIEFVAGHHGKGLDRDIEGKHVLMVDFSFKKDVILAMAKVASSITILDHHDSAQRDLADFATFDHTEGPGTNDRETDNSDWGYVYDGLGAMDQPNILVSFDMKKSGAMLAWEFTHPGQPAPQLVRYVQDRDLWRFELSRSRELSQWLFSHPYDFNFYDDAARWLEDGDLRSQFAIEGEAIERKHAKDIAELIPKTQRAMTIGGHYVPVANLPYTMASDGANRLARDFADQSPFAATYYDGVDKRYFSLRAVDDRVNVGQIAALYGGGGHKRAAGFEVPRNWEGENPLTGPDYENPDGPTAA